MVKADRQIKKEQASNCDRSSSELEIKGLECIKYSPHCGKANTRYNNNNKSY